MNHFTLTFICAIICLASLPAAGQLNRTYNGWGNHFNEPEWGSVGSLYQMKTIGYADGISEPGGQDRPSPRTISNALFQQNSLINDYLGLSAYTWLWGQIIDHDITLTPDHPTETMEIVIPSDDPYIQQGGEADYIIPLRRMDYDLSTGTSPDNPRHQINALTAFIDGSIVYGCSQSRCDWLRTKKNGKLKMTSDNLLPFNTLDGELDSEVDPGAPPMDMAFPTVKKWFVTGDVRTNENVVLTVLQTILAREHNRLCDSLSTQFPHWSDEQLFQRARKLVGAEMQAITYNEWLPIMGIDLPEYQGYNPNIEPNIYNAFSTAAFRVGHTLLNSLIVRMDNQGNYMPQGDLLLRDAFFNPDRIMEVGGIEPYLLGLATTVQQAFDCKMIDDVRNMLFIQHGAQVRDLASINIVRGRERGLPDYNTVRQDFGMAPVKDFSDITSNIEMGKKLKALYGNVNNIDAWVGMLAEDHTVGGLFGPTIEKILEVQFIALREGDRYYYENDPALNSTVKEWISRTTLSDLIRRNSTVDIISDHAFVAGPLTSTSELAVETNMSVQTYPNPVSQHRISVRIGVLNRTVADLNIMDLNGHSIIHRDLELYEGTNTLSLSLPYDMAAGNYTLSIQTEHGQVNKSLVVL